MEIKKIEEKDRKLKLLLKDTDVALINSIRRVSMSGVPVLAVHEVTFYENNSVMFDEFLALRLGLLPISSDAKSYALGDKVKFVLEKEGPCTVYSKDLKCVDPKIEIVDKKIPLTKLKEGQKLKLELTAVMDTGKTHVKYQPSVMGYQYLPIIESDKNIKDSKLQEVVTCCKDKILEVKPKRIVFSGEPDEVLCSKCVEISQAKTTHDYDKSSFIISMESHGNMENEQVLLTATEVLAEKTNEFKKALKEL